MGFPHQEGKGCEEKGLINKESSSPAEERNERNSLDERYALQGARRVARHAVG